MKHSGSALVLVVAMLVASAAAIAPAEEEAQLMDKYMKLLAEENEKNSDQDEGDLNEDETSVFDMLVGYSQLNSELESRLAGSTELSANLQAATQLDLSGHGDAKLSKAIECFHLLEKLRDERDRVNKVCGPFGDTILRLNLYLAGALKKNSRLAQLVRQVEKEHSSECSAVYPMKYKEALELNVDGELRARLMNLMSDDLVATFMASNPSFFVDLMYGVEPNFKLDSSWRNKLARALAPQLKAQTAADAELNFMEQGLTGKKQVEGKKFALAYEQLVKRPCQEFNQKLGHEIFEPAQLDIGATLSKEQLSKDDIQFAFGLFRFHVCSTILSDARGLFAGDLRQVL